MRRGAAILWGMALAMWGATAATTVFDVRARIWAVAFGGALVSSLALIQYELVQPRLDRLYLGMIRPFIQQPPPGPRGPVVQMEDWAQGRARPLPVAHSG